jgi:hypothetical protein
MMMVVVVVVVVVMVVVVVLLRPCAWRPPSPLWPRARARKTRESTELSSRGECSGGVTRPPTAPPLTSEPPAAVDARAQWPGRGARS